MLKMLRDELETKKVTIWEELCSIICCNRSRSYLDFILKNFGKREEAERERKEQEEAEREELLREELNKHKESIRRNKGKKDKNLSIRGSMNKKFSSKSSID